MVSRIYPGRFFFWLLLALVTATGVSHAGQSTETIFIRGHRQVLRTYGVRGSGQPVIVSSGDGADAAALVAGGYRRIFLNRKEARHESPTDGGHHGPQVFAGHIR